jgi:hypothetical protein
MCGHRFLLFIACLISWLNFSTRISANFIDVHQFNLQLPVQSVPITTNVVRNVLKRIRVMKFNTAFNNISVKSWWSVLLMEEIGENYWPATSHWQTWSHNVVSSTPGLSEIQTHNVSGDRHCFVLLASVILGDWHLGVTGSGDNPSDWDYK